MQAQHLSSFRDHQNKFREEQRAASHELRANSYQLSAVSNQLSAVSNQQSAISYQPSAISRQQSAISIAPKMPTADSRQLGAGQSRPPREKPRGSVRRSFHPLGVLYPPELPIPEGAGLPVDNRNCLSAAAGPLLGLPPQRHHQSTPLEPVRQPYLLSRFRGERKDFAIPRRPPPYRMPRVSFPCRIVDT